MSNDLEIEVKKIRGEIMNALDEKVTTNHGMYLYCGRFFKESVDSFVRILAEEGLMMEIKKRE